jgi:hypothetical protein
MWSHHAYLAPKEGDVAYGQQCDAILKPKHLQLLALLVIPDDTTFFCQIHEILKNDLLFIDIQGQLRNHHQIQDFSSDHVKFEFQDGLFYHVGLLYVSNGLT